MKASEKYWIKGSQPNTPLFTSPELFKKTYDSLVILEAKIEESQKIQDEIKDYQLFKWIQSRISKLELDYDKLIKANLWEQSEK
jgi:hypothetical protein